MKVKGQEMDLAGVVEELIETLSEDRNRKYALNGLKQLGVHLHDLGLQSPRH